MPQFSEDATAPIIGIDTEGRINEWNQKAADLTGFSEDEVRGQDLVTGFIADEFKARSAMSCAKHCREKRRRNLSFHCLPKTVSGLT